MHIRTILTTIVAAVMASALLAAAEAPAPQVVGTDRCTVGVDEVEGTSPDAEDLCEARFTVLHASADGPTTLAVELVAAGATAERLDSVVYGQQWSTARCEVRIAHRAGAVGDDGADRLLALCDGAEYVCGEGLVGETNCGYEGGEVHDVAIAAPSFDGTVVRWELTFDGELAVLAGEHALGAVLDPGAGFSAHEYETTVDAPVGPDMTTRMNPYNPGVCGLTSTDIRDCLSVLGDVVFPTADVTVTIG